MPLPEMHGRTHIPSGYAMVVDNTAPLITGQNPSIDPSDTIPATLGSAGTIKSFVGTATTSETITPGNSNLLWQTNHNHNPECFTPIVFSGSDYYQVRMLEDGLYTASVYCGISTTVAYGQAQVSISIYRSDRAQHNSKTWQYDATNGFNDGTQHWTFEMDGTGGSNRKIEFQFINFHTPIAGTDDNITATDIRVEVHKWPGSIVLT